jgi:hypothetical protein
MDQHRKKKISRSDVPLSDTPNDHVEDGTWDEKDSRGKTNMECSLKIPQ